MATFLRTIFVTLNILWIYLIVCSAQPVGRKSDNPLFRSFIGQAALPPTGIYPSTFGDHDNNGVKSQAKRSANPQYYDDYDYVAPSVVVHHTPVYTSPTKVVQTYSSSPAKVVSTYSSPTVVKTYSSPVLVDYDYY